MHPSCSAFHRIKETPFLSSVTMWADHKTYLGGGAHGWNPVPRAGLAAQAQSARSPLRDGAEATAREGPTGLGKQPSAADLLSALCSQPSLCSPRWEPVAFAQVGAVSSCPGPCDRTPPTPQLCRALHCAGLLMCLEEQKTLGKWQEHPPGVT